MSKFKSVVTALGQARIASAIESGKDVNITQLAVGDGNGSATTPSASQTALVHETYRLPLNSIKTDNKNANWIIAEAIIPSSIGGFWMREMGLFSSQGELIAVSNMADSYKPTLEEGSGRTQTLRMVITVTDTDAVTLTIDDTLVIATEEYVNNLLAEHEASRRHPDGTLTDKGFVQLSSAIDSASEVLAATPKAVKTVNDNANSRLKADKNLSDLADANAAKKALKLDKVGNYAAVQANGGLHSFSTYPIFLDWGNDSKLHVTVNDTDVGQLFTTSAPPTYSQVGAYPASGGNVYGFVNANYLGAAGVPNPGASQGGTYIGWNESGGQGESAFVCNRGGGVGGFTFRIVNSGNTAEVGRVTFSGSGSVYPNGDLNTGGLVFEKSQRVYSPNNPQPNIVQDMRFAASAEYQERSNNERIDGGVMTSFKDAGSSNYWIRIRQLQKLINNNWYTVGYS